ncbi:MULTISPECIES: hypothetical protein [unclassified Beijerinckia]|uniref:hypothetical protein n=1 Tax=unclassified Beijerinckia TaxID=2638183 RepID=UPI0011148005|nr:MULTISPECIES: hypothetical protein [unclassified Beijerinckia]MDH7797485.1 hypothetical protein [Beijerinckia sp. GAS462]
MDKSGKSHGLLHRWGQGFHQGQEFCPIAGLNGPAADGDFTITATMSFSESERHGCMDLSRNFFGVDASRHGKCSSDHGGAGSQHGGGRAHLNVLAFAGLGHLCRTNSPRAWLIEPSA